MVGDCHWLPTTPFETAVAYFPAPLVALRTLKAELILGLRLGQADHEGRDRPGDGQQQEEDAQAVAVRIHGKGQQGVLPRAQALADLLAAIRNRTP